MRKHVLQLASLLAIALAVALLAPLRAAADDDDPPTRVARLSHTDGNVSFEPAGTDDWVGAVINRPMTTGDNSGPITIPAPSCISAPRRSASAAPPVFPS